MGLQGGILSLAATLAKFLITLLLTYLMLVFGELVPKRVAIAKPERTARRSISPIYGLSKVTRPVVRLLAVSTNTVLKLFRIDPDRGESQVTEEEILLMMQEGQAQGAIEESEVKILSNVFAFTDLHVDDAMTHRTEIEAVSVDATISDVVSLMAKTGFHKYPVVDGTVDRIVGILYTQDMIALYPTRENDEKAPPIREMMRPPSFVPESKMLVELFGYMKRNRERMAVVVDEYGGTSGVITMMDIIEEIVGDTEIINGITDNGDGSYLIDGIMEMELVADFLGLEDEAESYDTFSGFLIDRLGYVPSPGQQPEIQYCGYRFRVEQVDGALIRRIRAEKKP